MAVSSAFGSLEIMRLIVLAIKDRMKEKQKLCFASLAGRHTENSTVL